MSRNSRMDQELEASFSPVGPEEKAYAGGVALISYEAFVVSNGLGPIAGAVGAAVIAAVTTFALR